MTNDSFRPNNRPSTEENQPARLRGREDQDDAIHSVGPCNIARNCDRVMVPAVGSGSQRAANLEVAVCKRKGITEPVRAGDSMSSRLLSDGAHGGDNLRRSVGFLSLACELCR